MCFFFAYLLLFYLIRNLLKMNKENLLLAFAIPIYFIFITWELYTAKKKEKISYTLKDTLQSLWFGIAGASLDIFTKGIGFAVLDWCNKHAFWQSNLLDIFPIAAWFILFIGQDFCFYWLHRAEHQSRIFWAVHSNHHSSPQYNFAVALRSSVLQPLYRFWFYVPIAFVGFDAISIMFVYAVNQFYQFFLHTEYFPKLGFFEKFLVTPSHHRVHHASNPIYLDKNMGQVFIVWDKIFGTFQEEIQEEQPVYGLTKPLETYHPIHSILHEFYSIKKDVSKSKSFLKKLKYVFAAPGWSPKDRVNQ